MHIVRRNILYTVAVYYMGKIKKVKGNREVCHSSKIEQNG